MKILAILLAAFAFPAFGVPDISFNGKEIQGAVFGNHNVEKILLDSKTIYSSSSQEEDDSWVVYNPSSDFQYITNNNAIVITNYIGSSVVANIPKQINGLNVEIIRTYAFKQKAVRSVYVPSTVRKLERYAFLSNASLTNLYIADGTTDLEYGAIYDSYAMTSLKLSNLITNMGALCFGNSSKLGTFTVPPLVTALNEQFLSGCYSLTNIDLGNVKQLNNNAFFSFPAEIGITVPATVTNVVNRAFRDSKFTNIVFTGTSTTIGVSVFTGCTKLRNITLPSGILTLDDYCLYGCTALTWIKIPASVTMIRRFAFYGCTGLYGAFFEGNQPPYDPYGGWFEGCTNINYRLESATGWPVVPNTYLNRPTAIWTQYPNPIP